MFPEMHSQKLRKIYCQTKTRSVCRFFADNEVLPF
jgi:hypothetical protein